MESTVIMALILALISSVVGWTLVKQGKQSKLFSLIMGILILVLTTLALGARGELRGACPLMDSGEVFLFIAWSLSIFYVFTGGGYRLSLLGLFNMPLVSLLLGLVLIPGMLTENPVREEVLDPWKESHAATSVLSYGALGLAALSGLMFLILDKRLKVQSFDSLGDKLPPVRSLITSLYRLLIVGVVVLTLGIIAGVVSSLETGAAHLITAGGVWVAYLLLIVWYSWKGMPPRQLAYWSIGLFIASCGIFFII